MSPWMSVVTYSTERFSGGLEQHFLGMFAPAFLLLLENRA